MIEISDVNMRGSKRAPPCYGCLGTCPPISTLQKNL